MVDARDFNMPYTDIRILGPYLRPDNRLVVITVKHGGQRSSVSYPKYLIESSLGRRLEFYEVVHHIDGNTLNNSLSNLTVMARAEHAKMHNTKYTAVEIVYCIWCGQKIELTTTQQRTRQQSVNRNVAGPFCSPQCSGLYGKGVQSGESRL